MEDKERLEIFAADGDNGAMRSIVVRRREAELIVAGLQVMLNDFRLRLAEFGNVNVRRHIREQE